MIGDCPFLILEGADGTGKTTLANALKARGYDVRHCGPPAGDPFAEYFMHAVTAARPTVFDRFHIGERVYGPIYRNEDKLGSTRMRMLERYLLSRGAVVVFCDPPLEVARENWERRVKAGGEMITNVNKWYEIAQGFNLAKRLTHLPWVVYDYTRHGVEWLELKIQQLAIQPNGGPGIGAWRPRRSILLIGEQCNGEHDAYPFIGDKMAGCSYWLAQQLEKPGIKEDALYWINARDNAGKETPSDFLDSLEPRRVIALGNVARAWAEKAGLHESLIAVPHPQFWKRFRYHERYPLVDLLP